MKLGELDIKKAYFGIKELTSNNAYIGIIPIIKDEEIPNNEIWYTSSDGNVIIPSDTNALPEIDTNTYNDDKGIIKFKTNVTSIGYNAFNNCASLTSIIIPNSVISIESRAFASCIRLISLTIPNSVTSIGIGAFYGCTSLTSVIIGDSVTSIGGSAFSNCTGLTSIIIGNNVESIEENAFAGCSSLTSVTINSNAIVNPTISYTDSKSIKDIFGFQVKNYIIGNNVIIIGDYTFFKCTNLKSVIIGDSVTSIGELAFCDCTSLTSITIPNSVTEIKYSAFLSCMALTDLYINDISAWCNIIFSDNTSNPLNFANNLYINNINVINLIIPENVTRIRHLAFCGCKGLTSITIPNSVTNIEESAFNNISVKILFSKLYSTYINKIFITPNVNTIYNVEFNISEIPTGYNISSMLPQIAASGKNTLTYNIYTDYSPCKDQALALATTKTIINVYHIDGTPWE